jgi:hypothetical protein
MVVGVIATSVLAIAPMSAPSLAREVAVSATITASSSELGRDADAVVDGVGTSGADARGFDWVADGEEKGAWLKLTWAQPQRISRVVFTPGGEKHRIRSASLLFSDGSSVLVTFRDTSRLKAVVMKARDVTWVKITVAALFKGSTAAGLGELRVYQPGGAGTEVVSAGNDGAAISDSAQAAASSHAPGREADALTDGRRTEDGYSSNASWAAGANDHSAWVELSWVAPRELSSIQLYGAGGGHSSILSGTLLFGDGSSLPVGAVLNDKVHPTTIAFMPRDVSSVRFTVRAVGGPGVVGLSEFAAFERGTSPENENAAAGGNLLPENTFPVTCPSASPNTVASAQITVICPSTNSKVTSTARLRLATSGVAKIIAQVLPANGSLRSPAVTIVPRMDGRASAKVDVSTEARGPITIRLEGYRDAADSTPDSAVTVYLQLYHSDGPAASGVSESDEPPVGTTLAFREEFTSPVSATSTGADAKYAASKPTASGAGVFGEAAFADPASGFDNLTIVDRDYLRIAVVPTPLGTPTPVAGGLGYIGGSMASSRVGGSGFSAQYGYFEARMLFPAGDGTWPAFWMLPSNNLIKDQKVVAEIDAVESYGHDPKSNCQATHSYRNGVDTGISICGKRFDSVAEAMQWHVYAVDVKPSGITYLIDGEEVATAPPVPGDDDPLFFLVNLAMGGGWPIDMASVGGSAAVYVDWVRVYT